MENWSERTGLPLSYLNDEAEFDRVVIGHLWTACYAVECTNRYFLHTAHGIRSSREWSLIRYLARLVLANNNWQAPEKLPHIDDLWRSLSASTLEIPESFDRYPSAPDPDDG